MMRVFSGYQFSVTSHNYAIDYDENHLFMVVGTRSMPTTMHRT